MTQIQTTRYFEALDGLGGPMDFGDEPEGMLPVPDALPAILSYQSGVAFLVGAAMAPNLNRDWWKWGLLAVPVVTMLGNVGLIALAGASLGKRVNWLSSSSTYTYGAR